MREFSRVTRQRSVLWQTDTETVGMMRDLVQLIWLSCYFWTCSFHKVEATSSVLSASSLVSAVHVSHMRCRRPVKSRAFRFLRPVSWAARIAFAHNCCKYLGDGTSRRIFNHITPMAVERVLWKPSFLGFYIKKTINTAKVQILGCKGFIEKA